MKTVQMHDCVSYIVKNRKGEMERMTGYVQDVLTDGTVYVTRDGGKLDKIRISEIE